MIFNNNNNIVIIITVMLIVIIDNINKIIKVVNIYL